MTEASNSALEKRIKKHVIGKPHRFMAVAPLGFEETLVEELKYIGVESFAENPGCGRPAPSCHSEAVAPSCHSEAAAPSCHSEERSDEESSNTAGIKAAGDGKVEFTAKITEAWKAVAYSRIANRILMEIGSFKAENFGQLEKGIAGIPWELYLPVCHSERSVAKSSCHSERSVAMSSCHSERSVAKSSCHSEQSVAKSSCHSEQSVVKSSCHSERSVAKSKNLDIHVTCKHSRLYHSDAVEERVRKIIEAKQKAQFLTTSGSQSQQPASCHSRPDREFSIPTQHLYINLQDDRCTLWLDLAGEELYKRGHERFVAEAPLKETIAAAMIFEAVNLADRDADKNCSSQELQGSSSQESLSTSYFLLPTTIVDPMAGSGTFSLEAAYIANGLIPGKCRDFALKHQPAFKEGTWNFILKGVDSRQYTVGRDADKNCSSQELQGSSSPETLPTSYFLLPTKIITSDISERPISIIKHNAEASPLAEIAKTNPDAVTINPQLKDFFSYTIEDICAVQPPANDTARDILILLNPPYGKRLSVDAPKLYTKIGQKLDQLSRDAYTRNSNSQTSNVSITVAILAPKDDTRGGAHYTCTENLLKACPALDPKKNKAARLIETSHGGFSLNAIFARI